MSKRHERSDSAARLAHRIARRLCGAADSAIERRYGLRTRRSIALEDLGLGTQEGERIWHHPSEWISVRRALAALEPGRGDVLLDLGSGMGRAVLIASRLPFQRVIGVELSEDLTAAARRNVEQDDRRRKCPIELVTADAAEYLVPDEVTVVYLYCPFTGRVFEQAINNVLASIDRRPRLLRLVYNYPAEHTALLSTGRAHPVDVAPGKWPTGAGTPADVIVTYVLLPQRTPYPTGVREQLAIADRKVPLEWLGPHDPGFVLEKPTLLGRN